MNAHLPMHARIRNSFCAGAAFAATLLFLLVHYTPASAQSITAGDFIIGHEINGGGASNIARLDDSWRSAVTTTFGSDITFLQFISMTFTGGSTPVSMTYSYNSGADQFGVTATLLNMDGGSTCGGTPNGSQVSSSITNLQDGAPKPAGVFSIYSDGGSGQTTTPNAVLFCFRDKQGQPYPINAFGAFFGDMETRPPESGGGALAYTRFCTAGGAIDGATVPVAPFLDNTLDNADDLSGVYTGCGDANSGGGIGCGNHTTRFVGFNSTTARACWLVAVGDDDANCTPGSSTFNQACLGGQEALSFALPTVALKSDGSTLPVTLSSFRAEAAADSLHFTWSTAIETANVGFHLYAERNGATIRLNDQLIPSHMSFAEMPQEYSVTIAHVLGDADAYWIADVDIRGRSHLHGPFLLNQSHGQPMTPEPVNWTTVVAEHNAKAEQRSSAAIAAINRTVALQRLARDASLPSRADDPLLEQIGFSDGMAAGGSDERHTNGASSQAQLFLPVVANNVHRTLSATPLPVVELRVNQSGLYRVTFEDLLGAGFDLGGVASSELALVNRGQPVPMHLVSGTLFGPGAYFDFVGEAVDTLYTTTNVYTLRLDPTLARRSGANPSKPDLTQTPTPSYFETTTVDRNRAYRPFAPNGDPWIDSEMLTYRSAMSWTFDLTIDNVAASTPATLTVSLWGSTDWSQAPDHHTLIALNGATVAESTFDGLADVQLIARLPGGLLRNGANSLSITLPGDTGVDYDLVALDRYTLTYPASFVARDGRLTFTTAADLLRVSGLPPGNVLVFYLDDGKLVRMSQAVTTTDGATNSVTFAGLGDREATFLVYAESALRKPKLTAPRPTVDISSGQVSYLVISHPDFIADLDPLVQARQAQGFSVRVVNVEEIYAQISDGIFDPTAIQRYIAQAAASQGVRFVLLVGGDTYDYHDNLGLNSVSFIPSLYAATGDIVAFAPVDPLFVDFDHNGSPDLPIGRLPVRTEAELQSVIAKTLAFDARAVATSALFVADAADGIPYSAHSEAFAAQLDASWKIDRVYLDQSSVEDARGSLLKSFNQGPNLVSFVGHSEPSTWTFAGLFSSADAAALTNADRPAIVSQYGCWNTYYVSASFNTLGHKLMLSGNRGAAAVLGAATLTEFASEQQLGELFFPRLAQPGMTIGQALQDAKQELAASRPDLVDVLLGWTLLGDPALVLQR